MKKAKHNKIDNVCNTIHQKLMVKHIDEKIIDRNTLEAAKAEYYEHQTMLKCGQYPAITVFKNDDVDMCYIYVDKCKDLCLPF